MSRKLVQGLLLAASLLGAHGPAQAASGFSNASSAAGETAKFAPQDIVAFAKKVERTLAASNARVAILARMGRPLAELPKGFRYTHVAFAVYSQITTADGRKLPGYAIHNLYQKPDRPDISELVQDYPADFFAGVAELEAGIIVPSQNLQNRLLEIITSSTYQAVHEPRYSVIANPYTTGRQNCTEFVLDVVNAAIYQTADTAKLKAAAKAYFPAQPVNVNPFKALFGAMFIDEVSISDHPSSPETATFEKMSEYLAKYDDGARTLYVYPQ